MIRYLVRDRHDPRLERTIEISSAAPTGTLGLAFDIAVGRGSATADERIHEPDFALNPDHRDQSVETTWIGSRAARNGEPVVQVLSDDDDRAAPASAHWQHRTAPFRPAHVQSELELQFGYVAPSYGFGDTIARDMGLSPAAPLLGLMRALAPQRRLALRAHLEDSGMLEKPKLTTAEVEDLLMGFRWCIERLGDAGAPQGPDGWVSEDLVRESERALEWPRTSSLSSPMSPGEALWSLMRSIRLARRLKGRIVATGSGRRALSRPERFLREVPHDFSSRDWRSRWGTHEHLVLLAVADGTASDERSAVDTVFAGIRELELQRDPYGYEYYDYGPSLDENGARQASETAVALVLGHLAPLGGRGGYGCFTPAIRRFSQLILLEG